MNPPKVCFTTYIYGDKYQNFIPWVLYSVGKSYSEYHVIIFINGSLRDDLRPLIDKIKGNFDIVENTFNDCPKMVPVKAQSLRWVLWHEKFKEFDYLYYIDVDMLFIREPIPMHEQHIRHMNFIGSDCVSNILRRKVLPHGIKDWYTTYFNLKYGGVKSVVRQMFARSVLRVSGIHFVKVSTYFKYLAETKIEKYKKSIYSNKGLRRLAFVNDEHFLYKMLEECGVDMSRFAIQQTSTTMFGMNTPEKAEFCPHHGLHMGIFRMPVEGMPKWATDQLESDDYAYYITEFKRQFLHDPLFNELLAQSPQHIKDTFKRMYQYYKIEY